MGNSITMDFNQAFRGRTKNFSVSVIKSLSSLPYSDDLSIVRKQIIRSATSVAAIYRPFPEQDQKKKDLQSSALLLKLSFGSKSLKN
jgi:four helix bundle protein